MWIMTSFGILMPSVRPADTVPAGDNRLIQVRTRRRQDLDILREQYMAETLGPTVYMKDTDYEYRAYCTHVDWATAMAKMSLDIDYTKFKPTTDRYHDDELHTLYNKLWSTIFTALSTIRHQTEYWGLTKKQQRRYAKLLNRQNARGWETLDEDDFESVLDEWAYEIDTSDVDDLTAGPDVRPNGTLDHTACTHGHSKNANRRCRAKWLKNARIK